jgi:MFS family permease
MTSRLEGRVRVLTGTDGGKSTPVIAVTGDGGLVVGSDLTADRAGDTSEHGVTPDVPEQPPVDHQARDAMTRERHHRAFWMVSFAFLSVMAFSGVPSPLYGLYRARDHFSLFMVTVIYAAYAVGVIGSLLLAGHLSDWYGRRRLLVPALCVATVSAVVFVVSKNLTGLLLGRLINGIAIGVVVSTATAFLSELHAVGRPEASPRRAQLIASAIPVGGLGLGAFVAGLLAQWVAYPLTVPYLVFLAALVLGTIGVALSPETHHGPNPHPRYRPQRVSVPINERGTFFATALSTFVAFATVGLFTGLSAVFLATSLHQSSHALAGTVLGVMFAAGVGTQVLIAAWPIRREYEAGVAAMLLGLGLAVLAMWLNPPSLGLFIAGGALIGAGGGGAIFKAAVATVMRISPPDRMAESVAGLFLASFVGISLPVVGAGITLSRHVSPKATLLGFAIAVGVGIAVSAIRLLAPTSAAGGGGPSPARRSIDSSEQEHDQPPTDDPNERRAA